MGTQFNTSSPRYSSTKKSGSGGGLVVSEADGSPMETVSGIVFNGQSGVGGETVTIIDGIAYINGTPPPSPLGGNLTMSGTTLFTGRESQNNINYETIAGAVHNYITTDVSFTLSESEFNNASIGNLIVLINNIAVANIDLGANFNESNRSGSQNLAEYNNQGTGDVVTNGRVLFSGGFLQLNSIQCTGTMTSDNYQAGSFQISINSTAMRQGYNHIDTSHNFHSNNTFKLFYDTDVGLSPSATNSQLVLDTVVGKHISGVEYCYTGTTFNFDVTVNNAFDHVYHQSNAPIVISSDWGISDTIAYTDSSASGTSTPPTINDIMNISNKEYTLIANQETDNARLTITPRDPYANYSTAQTPSNNIMIMSIPNASTTTSESFVDEVYRFPLNYNFNVSPSSITGNWDSTLNLGSNDLQVYSTYDATTQCLIHPHDDFSNDLPINNPDYSTLSGGTDKEYVRIFQGSSDNSNGILTINGITDADLGSNVNIFLKVPSKTDWIDISSSYVFSTFNENVRFVNTTWTAITNFAMDDWVVPTVANGYKYKVSSDSGSSAGTEPTWGTTIGGTTVDGGITWTCYGIDSKEGCRINPTVHSIALDNSIEFTLGLFASDSSVNRNLFVKIVYANNSIPRVITDEFSINW